MKLNDRTVTATKPALPPNKSEAIIFCEDTPGFGIRIRAGGSRSWIYQFDLPGGRTRRITLGKFPKVSARQARETVETLASKLGLGIDPAQEKLDRRIHGDTFEGVKNLYLAAQAKRLKPRSLIEVERHLTVHCKPLHKLAVDKIGRRDIAELLTTIANSKGPVAANRVRSSISAMLNWALRAGRAENNPAAFVNKEREQSRARVLTDDEVAAIWQALPEGHYGTILKLLFLCGARRNEIGNLAWSEVDLERGLITLPPERVKNNRPFEIPITAPMLALLAATPRVTGRHFVFGYGNGGFSGWSRCKERLDQAINAERDSPLAEWSLHDARRYLSTRLSDLGTPPHICEQILNHQSHRSGVASVYNKSRYAKEVREALTRWGRHIQSITAAKSPRRAKKARRAA
jgi:integrase